MEKQRVWKITLKCRLGFAAESKQEVERGQGIDEQTNFQR